MKTMNGNMIETMVFSILVTAVAFFGGVIGGKRGMLIAVTCTSLLWFQLEVL